MDKDAFSPYSPMNRKLPILFAFAIFGLLLTSTTAYAYSVTTTSDAQASSDLSEYANFNWMTTPWEHFMSTVNSIGAEFQSTGLRHSAHLPKYQRMGAIGIQ